MQTWLSTVGVFQTRFQVNSGSVSDLLTVVACKLGLSTVGLFEQLFGSLTLVLSVVCQRSLHANLVC